MRLNQSKVNCEKKLNIEKETFKEELVQKIDSYMNYVKENWMKENELVAIERGLRTEITEDFIRSLRGVFTEHYIEVPEDKYDILGDMEKEIEELKGKLNEQIDVSVSLKSEKESMIREKIIGESSDDLTITEQEKLTSLLEDVDFGSSEMFAEKVSVVKENYFPKQITETVESEKLTDTVDEKYLDEGGSINKYGQAISKQIKSKIFINKVR